MLLAIPRQGPESPRVQRATRATTDPLKVTGPHFRTNPWIPFCRRHFWLWKTAAGL